jgi:ABC-type lipoprotein export system ATPase subunit
MIEARNLKKVYKMKKGVIVKALDDVSVKLPDTGMVFILGKSGSGKSTLLNVLGGLDSIDSGEIIIKGTSAKDFKQSHYDSYRNTYIGFIFQEYNVLEELTVGANVALAIELQGRKATDEEINSILKEVDLEGYGNRKPNELSGGQKQRVAIARALVKKPEIIMADEPTGALDSTTGKQVFDTLKKLSKDKLVLIVSHDREFSEQYADRIIELKDGVIISDVEKEGSEYADFTEAEADDSITYGDGEITIKPGYTLTEEDRVAINEYLTALRSGAKIKVGETKLKKKFSSKDFVPTDESRIVSHKKGDFKLIKSKLSIKNAFKLGSGGLKHKKVRLVFTIFLSLISFTLFGLADTIAAYDNISTATTSIYDTGVDYASFVKSIKQGSGDYKYWTNSNTLLSPEDIDVIKAQTGHDVVGVYKRDSQLSFSSNLGKNKPDGINPEAIYMDSFSGITGISEAIMTNYGFELVGGKLPTGKNEIAITKYTYDYFASVGYLEYDNEGKEVVTEIKSVNDIIGKTLTLDTYHNGSGVYTVSGVIDVKFDYSRYEKLADDNAQFTVSMIEMMALQAELEAAQSYSFASMCFVSENTISDIIADAQNKPDSLYNASVSYYLVNDDSMESPWDIYGEDGSNVLSSSYIGSVYSLEKIKDNVLFFPGKAVTELADNQIIVDANYLFSSLGYEPLPEAWYNLEKLTGDEAEIYKVMQFGGWLNYQPTLENILHNPAYFYAYRYAMKNESSATAVIKEVYQINDEEIQMRYPDKYGIYNEFANIVNEPLNFNPNGVDTGITEQQVIDYVNGLITRYGLDKCIIDEEMAKQFATEYVYEGKTYVSYDTTDYIFTEQYVNNANTLLGRRYAAENLEDAIRYYTLVRQAELPEGEEFVLNIEDAVSRYGDYVAYGNMHFDKGEGQLDFTPSQDAENFKLYKAKILINFYKPQAQEGKPILAVDAYGTDYRAIIKNAEIIGVYVDTTTTQNDMFYAPSGAVLSENLISKILGPNRNGLYSYAVGKMPVEKLGINGLVKFSKTYLNDEGNVRYDLSNNVTEQLNMVDEILDILGQVFLYVGLGFALFASVMLANFISTSISHKKQDIGILRAIGSRSGDVFRIFFAESFIIAMINYVLAVAGTLSVTIVINSLLRNEAGLLITFLNFGIRQIGLLLGVSLLVAFIATLFPVKKIASLKPIDAIKNRK